MTKSTGTLDQWVKTLQVGVPQCDPAIVVTHENQIFVWTSSVNHAIRDIQVSEDTGNTPMQVSFSPDNFGITINVRVPSRIAPNAVFVQGKESNSFFVYSFGDKKYPFLIRYNLATHEEENLNPKDELDIGGNCSVSSAAKTCVFGKGDEYILVTSKENELLIYSVPENKFIARVHKLEKFLTDEDRKPLSVMVEKYISKARDTNYLCKIKEENNVAEFFMINDSYVTLLTIGYKDKKFRVKPKYMKNNFTNVVEHNKIQHFGCFYFSEYETVMVCGGIDAQYKTKNFVCFYNIRSDKFYFSKLKLPETMAHHAIVYLKDQNWLYVIPGARYINKKQQFISYGYYISLDAYKPLLVKSKKEMIVKLSNEKLSNKKLKSNKD